MSDNHLSPHIGQHVTVDDRGVAFERVLYAAFNQRQLSGELPHVARAFTLTHTMLDIDSFVPDGMSVSHSYQRINGGKGLLARNDRCALLIQHKYRRAIEIVASATDLESAESIVNTIHSRIPKPRPSRSNTHIDVWHSGSAGPTCVVKSVRVPTWRSIEGNYPPSVSMALDDLMKTKKPEGSGRLILWHGEPGTGKTTALRALMRAWRGWCSASYVADPERLFGSPEYLLQVVGRTESGIETKWQLLIAEDSDEFLRTSARREAGAALGRLLNLSDGILGQGSNILILLATNERLDTLHPALVRPGRCLSHIEFHAFSPSEAARWMPRGVRQPTEPTSLAELIEIAQGRNRITNSVASVSNIGNYI